MSILVIIDTGVLLNILKVPGNDEQHQEVITKLTGHIDAGDSLFLPMATILETGNHIADIKGGGENKRKWGKIFVQQIEKALRGEAPWTPLPFPNPSQMLEWLDEFPDKAMCGLGMADVTILKEWESLRKRHPMSQVKIWATDSKFDSYR